MDIIKNHFSIIFLIAVTSFSLVSSSARTKSMTWDEPTYIVSGYSYLDKHEIKLNPESPPFLQALIALPLQFLELQSPDYNHPFYSSDRQVAFAYMFLDANKEKFNQISFWSRLPIWLLFALLVLSTGFFLSRIIGAASGVIASLLVASSPNLIAHAQLATTDFGCTVFMFISVCTFYFAMRANNYLCWVLCGVVTAIALLSKFTAMLLAPIIFLLLLYEFLINKSYSKLIIRGLLYYLFTLLLILSAGYGFKPWLYLSGMSEIYARALEYQPYLFGKVLGETIWYYYLAAFLVKTPVPTLLLLILSVYIAIQHKTNRNITIYLLIPVAVILLVCSFDVTNIGLRRILPIYPFLFSFISFTYFYIQSEKSKKLLFYMFITLNIFSVLTIYPNYISYFNIVAGGASNGANLLEDSNIDWGQDLPALVEWQEKYAPDDIINIKYFGAVNPSLYGLKYRRINDIELITPNKGIYAISVHYLIYTRKLAYWNNKDFDWLKLYKPIGYAGNSIYIYQF